MKSVLAVLTVVAGIIGIWYLACVPMNIKGVLDAAERAGTEVVPATARERRDASALGLVANNSFAISSTWSVDRPRLPAPHQVAVELWQTTVEKKITSKRSLIYHAQVTLSATLLALRLAPGWGSCWRLASCIRA